MKTAVYNEIVKEKNKAIKRIKKMNLEMTELKSKEIKNGLSLEESKELGGYISSIYWNKEFVDVLDSLLDIDSQ